MSKTWRDVWIDNYNNRSDAAKDIDNLMKKNYKGHKYVPWAVMVKWFYLMDSDATLTVLENDDGGLVFTDTTHINSSRFKSKENGYNKSHDSDDTRIDYHSHFVKVECVFLGKKFVEVYPIQDNAYNAPNFHDSNMVNKALQRAKAKLISTATGLGYQLYEFGDLQFEDDGKDIPKEKTNTVKETVPAPKKPVEDKKSDVIASDEAVELAKFILDNLDDPMKKVIQTMNPSIVKSTKLSLNPDDGMEGMLKVFENVKNIKVFSNAFKKRYENEKGSN